MSGLLDKNSATLSATARKTGETLARKLFAARGNHSEAHLSEYELALACAAAAEIAVLMTAKAGAMSDRASAYVPVRCDQCEMLSINGRACHEMGCPNRDARWDAESGQWVRQYTCFECGCKADNGTVCCDEELSL